MFKMLNAGSKPAARIIAGVAAGATLLAGMAFAPAANAGNLSGFTDTPDWQWYAGAVKWVRQHGVMTGYNNGKFGPENKITREEAAVLFWKKANEPQVADDELGKELDKDFADEEDIHNFGRQAFAWNARNNVMTGVDMPWYDADGNIIGKCKFASPNDPLTREMLATVIARDLKVNTANVDTTRMDHLGNSGAVSAWARNSIAWAVNKGILRGWPDSRGLDPQGTVTRAQAATMIARAMGGNPGGALGKRPAPKPKPQPKPRPQPSRPHIPTLAEEEKVYPFSKFLKENPELRNDPYLSWASKRSQWISYCKDLVDAQTPGTVQWNCDHHLGCPWND